MHSFGIGIVVLLVLAVLTFLLGSRSAEETETTGQGFALVYGKAWKGLVKLLFLFPVIIGLVAVFSPPDPEERWIPFAIIGGVLAVLVPLFLEVSRREVRVDTSGLRSCSAWSACLFLSWEEVVDVRWKSAAGEVEFCSGSGRRMRVSLWLTGQAELGRAIERHLPHLPSAQSVARRLEGWPPT